ncbi:hypothetical protein [Kitasatospora terrestris]
MGDPLEPPEGTPEGGSGNEDEFRSVVFDESFVRAARIQELSARERLGAGHPRATKPRVGLGPLGSLPRQAVALMLLVVMAFAAAVYFGISSPRRQATPPSGNQLTAAVVALAPAGAVTAVADPKDPFAPLTGYGVGAAGFGIPPATPTTHFTRSEVTRALETVQRYLTASALAPATVARSETGAVRSLVTPGEQAQYEDSVDHPRDDQHHTATGWLVRFDPGQVALADESVRVRGAAEIAEADNSTLEITTDHTFVYALRPAGTTDDSSVSLYWVRRELRFEFDRTDLGSGQLRLVDAVTQAGPTACGAVLSGYLQPVLATAAGVTVPAPPAVDPGDHAAHSWQLCGVLRTG